MKKLVVMITFLALLVGTMTAQEVQNKKEEMKVVIVKKKKDGDGKIIEERIEANGEEAIALMKKMREEEDIEGLDVEMEIGEHIILMNGNKAEKGFSIIMSDGKEKKSDTKSMTINVTRDGEDVIMKIKENGEGYKYRWKEGENVPEEVQKYIDEGKVKMNFDDRGTGYMKIEVETEEEEEVLPELNVRMGMRLAGKGPVKIVEIERESPAQKAGLLSGDVITEIDDYYIPDYIALIKKLSSYEVGDKIKIRYVRKGKAANTSLELIAQE